jgi:hypothetical protein
MKFMLRKDRVFNKGNFGILGFTILFKFKKKPLTFQTDIVEFVPGTEHTGSTGNAS